jgi:glycosyltransferase involved in cell wall biosynthesis
VAQRVGGGDGVSARVALLVRSDSRGLGRQTHDYFLHLNPAKALHIRMSNSHGAWTPYVERHDEWYPGVPSADFNGNTGTVDEDAYRWLLTDVDVLLTAETVYDHRAWGWAREMGVRTVLVGNPEFLGPDKQAGVGPDVIVLPSPWRLDTIPGAIHVPQPVDRGVFAFSPRPLGDPPRFLHVVGNRATRDRAGTDIVLDCLRFLRHRINLTVRTQGPLSAPQELVLRGLRRHQIPNVVRADLEDPRELYAEHDVLLAPRRYGGLSLPLNEAASCGLALLAGNREPERSVLPQEALCPVAAGREVTFQGGTFRLEDVTPQGLAAAIDRLVENPGIIARLSEASGRYAARIAWESLRPDWLDMLDRTASLAVTP